MPWMRLSFVVLECSMACSLALTQTLSSANVAQPGDTSVTEQNPSATAADSSSASNEQARSPVFKSIYNPKTAAWEVLTDACGSQKVGARASATRALGLLKSNIRARLLAEKALKDPKPEVRTAGAEALGEMGARKSIPKLRNLLDDEEPSVALAAAHSLHQMHDKASYEVYYEVLTRERKSNKGLIAAQLEILHDPKKMAQLGFEEGIGFVPFAGIGWSAFKEIKKNDSSPVRAASARMLADDPDPTITAILEKEAADKSWIVRAAALEALSRRGDPSALSTVERYVGDEENVVSYTAAAATLHLLAIQESRADAAHKATTESAAKTLVSSRDASNK